MNRKIVISISLIITVTIVGFSLTQNEMTGETVKEQTSTQFEETDKIESMLKKIEEDRIKNENSDKPYFPKEREWIKSGPFMIDRSEYVLGEKIFVNIMKLDEKTKGTMVFAKNINSTHNYEYKKIKFDGSKPQQNFYLGFTLNPVRGLCTTDKLIGDWELIFRGTNTESLKFKVLDQIIPGMEDDYKPVC